MLKLYLIMATMKELRDERVRKLDEIKALGLNPFPAETHRTAMAGEIIDNFEKMEGQTVSVAGRIAGIRKFGKLAFIVLRDFSGKIQLFIQANTLAETSAQGNLIGIKNLNFRKELWPCYKCFNESKFIRKENTNEHTVD